ncbi:MAG: outer membrane protein transport protein [Thiobacillus sp.]|jgi:long-chain fatty acid transport protein|uniref:OmpP1/FadL family transporter n=1 Tax=Thiobacillus sp. TaxID=924 RepID=UPI002895B324|nr:outer membrane protein transport protein [Thiobacillus sp.]MDT3705878.1 outer membrane protein transport protein [Thiobacillus sp.]
MSYRVNRLAAGLALAGCTHLAHAAGFSLIEQNASGLGNAYAGAAAVAEDASTIYFNPAGMTLLPDRQLVVVGHLIKPKMEFSGTVTPAVGGGQGGDAGDLTFVPNAYFAYRLTPDVHLGLGLNSPFGLKTEYDTGWVGRFQALKSEVKTININPSIAWKVNDQLSLGGGLNVQRVEATLTNNISPAAPGSLMTVDGDDYGWGWNLGVLWQPATGTRIGLSYRSEVDYTLEGTLASNVSLPLPPSGEVTANLTLPASASLSVFHKLSPNVDVLADVTWTGWSSFDRLAVVYTSIAYPLPPTPENWDDNWRYSLGATWHMSDAWSLRGGVAYDETPVPDFYRTPRIPDGSRTWLSVGGQYRFSERSRIDFGYAHLFVEEVGLKSPPSGPIILTGEYDNAVDILSAQYTHSF